MGEAKKFKLHLLKHSQNKNSFEMMAATVAKDSEVQIFREDQVKINTFAKKNHKLQELKEELKARRKEVQNLEDAETEIMMLDDEDADAIPIQVGEVFMLHSTDSTSTMLEQAKELANEDITRLQAEIEGIEGILKNLKVQLYAKFGDGINLEEE